MPKLNENNQRMKDPKHGFCGFLIPTLTSCALIVAIYFISPSLSEAVGTINKPPYYLSLQTNLAAHYTFDSPDMLSNIRDRGLGNTGYLVHGGSGTTTAIGVLGQAGYFDGVDDYVTVPNNTAFDLSGSVVTVSAWVKLKSDTGNAQMFVVKPASGSIHTAPYFSYSIHSLDSESIRFCIATAGQVTFSEAADCAFSANESDNLKYDEWTHVVGIYDGTKSYLYVNGAFVDDLTKSGNLNSYDTPLRIGTNGGFSELLNGAIDDVRVYSRALDASEVAALYTFGKVRMNSRPHAGAAFTNGLVGHWTLDGADTINNIVDQSGQGNTGYLVMGATLNLSTTTVPGVLGQALYFDGSSDYITIPHNSSLKPSAQITISAWVKPDVGSLDSLLEIYRKEDGTDRHLFSFQNSANCSGGGGTGGCLSFGISTGGSYAELDVNIDKDNYEGKWSHLTATYDSLNKIIYRNGAQIGSVGATGAIGTTGTAASRIGAYPEGAEYFKGSIDDIRVYSRALIAPEIYQLYSFGKTKIATTNSGKISGLVGHWTFDGPDLLQNVRDRSLQGNRGLFIPGASGNTSTTTAPGKIGQALSFDGVDDKVAVDDSSSLDLTDFTISMWFKRKGAGTVGGFAGCFSNGVEFLTSKGLGGGDNTGIDSNWALGVVQSTAKLAACFEGTTGTDYILSAGATTILNDRWYHVALTHTAASTVVYLDAAVDASRGTTANPANNNIKVGIGYGTEGASSAADGLFNGLIDDVRIYNRALSAAEVLQLYRLGR
ncbi:MAG: hypothetical protein A3G59_00875 [Candidatus Taylorbacteria bacterium RIFCSPLOWO2_12_FULL_47_20]|uniref:LamG-like jellyroll fold domain-containing protein n=1 Tax=Candidatus Taylorbacteria bacterium RIFCSPLOWO2_12_FULL_47_20 TaxID=1802335 RepID=A0A1G2PAF2_9BACT|nr:MAG: hypothetical protein A3G59_00875 [Candidatus Taylorbacteria bacterium RIFCSPLOWO2_12_FULL_47_20]